MVRCRTDGPPTLRTASCDRVLVEPVAGVQASDHFGVTAELALPQAALCRHREADSVQSVNGTRDDGRETKD